MLIRNLNELDLLYLQTKYSYLTNYVCDDPTAPIDPLTYMDSNGDSLIHVAASIGDIKGVDILLKAGVDPNILGDMGFTPLHYAENKDVAQLLIDCGASIAIRNDFGQIPKSFLD